MGVLGRYDDEADKLQPARKAAALGRYDETSSDSGSSENPNCTSWLYLLTNSFICSVMWLRSKE